jgi:hypothetical protein
MAQQDPADRKPKKRERTPLRTAVLAALLHGEQGYGWDIADRLRTSLSNIVRYFPCSGCSVVAGEFSTYNPAYISCYRNVVLHSYCHKTSNTYYYKRYWFGKPRDPVAWGFHDYEDLLNLNKHFAQEFAKFTHKRLNKPRLFMSEAGVPLQDVKETEFGELKAKTEAEKAHKRELQQKAAEIYLHLAEKLSYPIDRMYCKNGGFKADPRRGRETRLSRGSVLRLQQGREIQGLGLGVPSSPSRKRLTAGGEI